MRRPASVPIETVARFLRRVDAACRADALDGALAELTRALNALDPHGQVYFGFYRREAPPIVLDTGEPDAWNRSYPDGYYLLDPCYEAFLCLEADTCLLPQDVYPPAFRRSEFYLSYYRPMGMVDEVCFLLRLGADVAAYVSVMRLGAARRFTTGECALLQMALPALAIAMRHVHLLFGAGRAPSEEDARTLHNHLSAAFQNFGRDALSEREAEVTRLLLKGLAPKVVGSMLDIAQGTVRNHIKSIYAKIGVRSQAELLAAFFDALAGRATPPR